MKKLTLVFLILLIINIASAQDNYNTYKNLEIDFLLNSEISLIGSGNLNKLTATIFLNPEGDNNQDILSLKEFSIPQADISSNENLVFEWIKENPIYNLGYNAKIKTKNTLYKVPEIKIPLPDLSSDYQKFLQSEEITDINSNIIAKTSEIIGNEDNSYLAVHKIASWIHYNIEYNLTTLTEKASKKSSWVLENRYGVCDEITSLFISMTRSIGMPARFVSGMAYTNVGDYFGNHGWAEVYYPGYGWVPYDVTYGQFGWIDPTHISLQKSKDVENSIIYQWQSTGSLKLDLGKEIKTVAEISNLGSKIEPIFEGSIKTLEEEVSPGSYVPIRIKLENPYNYYISDQIIITKAPDLTEKNQKTVALKPLEKKEIFWIVKVPDNIKENFVYTAMIEFTDLFGLKKSTTITFGKGYKKITLEEAQETIDALTIEEDRTYSNQIVLNCNPTKSYFYLFETAEVLCHVRTFNSQINGLSLCLNNSCEDFNMQQNQEKEIAFELEPTKNIVKISLKNSEIEIKRNILLSVIEKPEIKISRIDLTEVDYNEEIELPIVIYSETLLKDIKLRMNNFAPVNFDKIEGTKEFTLTLNSKGLNSEKLKIKLEFLDEFGNSYEQEYRQKIIVNNLPWYWKLINLFRR